MTRDTQTRKGGPRKPAGAGTGRSGPRNGDSRGGPRKPDSAKRDYGKGGFGKGGFGKQDRSKRSFDKPEAAAGASGGGRWQKFGDRPAREAGAGGGRPGKRPDFKSGGFSKSGPKKDGGQRVLRRPERPAQDWDSKPKSRSAAPPSPRSEATPEGERIAKVIARAGLCSRRDAELWIEAGRVSVNGGVLESPAFNVKPGDRILVDGEPLAERERTRLFLFHKPRGVVTTARDPEGRSTIYDVLPDDLPRLVTVGRLDINTEGLLLLTNDGGLARVMELPETGWLRRYRVRAHGHADPAALERLADGVTIDGVEYRGIEARVDRQQGDNVWISIGLREGKNREIKRVLEHIGLAVNRLIRVSFGPFQLNELEEGAVEEIRTRILQDQLGEKLTQEAGADFEAPIFVHGASEPEPEIVAKPARGRPERTSGGRGVKEREYKERGAPRDGARERARPGDRFSRPRDDAPRSGFERRKAEDEAPKRLGKPEAPKRKHVKIMREEAASDPRRMRSESGEVQDRRGRRVLTEKRVSAAPQRPAREAQDFKPRDERGPRPERQGKDRKPFAEGPGRRSRPEGARPDGTRADSRKSDARPSAGKSFDNRRGDDSKFRGKIKGKIATRFEREFESADKPKRPGRSRSDDAHSGAERSGAGRSGPERKGPARKGPERKGSGGGRSQNGARPAPPRRPRRDD